MPLGVPLTVDPSIVLPGTAFRIISAPVTLLIFPSPTIGGFRLMAGEERSLASAGARFVTQYTKEASLNRLDHCRALSRAVETR